MGTRCGNAGCGKNWTDVCIDRVPANVFDCGSRTKQVKVGLRLSFGADTNSEKWLVTSACLGNCQWDVPESAIDISQSVGLFTRL